MTDVLETSSKAKGSSAGPYDPRFDALSHHIKRVLSVTAKRALETEYPDVILSIDKILLINRKPRRPKKRIDGYYRKIERLPLRILRPEYEYTVKPVPLKTWEDLCADYTRVRRRNKRVLRKTIEAGEIIPFGWKLFKFEDILARKPRMLKRLAAYQKREPYIYTQRLYYKIANTKAIQRKRERKVLKALSTPNSPQKAARAAKWFAWRDRMRKELPLRAEYFNWRIRVFREEAHARGLQTSKVRPLKPCLDLNHETYYRTLRDKYIPYEIFNSTFNPYPPKHETRIRYPEKIFPPIPNTL